MDAEPEVREKEEQIFKQVSEAYSVLSDPKKKSRYDNGYDLEETGGMGKFWEDVIYGGVRYKVSKMETIFCDVGNVYVPATVNEA